VPLELGVQQPRDPLALDELLYLDLDVREELRGFLRGEVVPPLLGIDRRFATRLCNVVPFE